MNGTLPERIFICGFMGTGKSTIGKALAQHAAMLFYDLDDYIEEQSGQSISAIFEDEGEGSFRKKEVTAMQELIRNKKGVIALGGGTLQNQAVVDHIKAKGLLVFIETPVEEIIERISSNKNRPLLLNKAGQLKAPDVLKQELVALYRQRLPFYEQAEMTFSTKDYSSVNEMANHLVKKISCHVAQH